MCGIMDKYEGFMFMVKLVEFTLFYYNATSTSTIILVQIVMLTIKNKINFKKLKKLNVSQKSLV